MAENQEAGAPELIELATEITIAWLQNPNVTPGAQDVPAFLKDMHAAISALGSEPAQAQIETHEPKVPVRSSVKPDHIVSLIDGKKYKTLKRHLALNGLTPEGYRARFGLKADYPMVAPDYAAQRRAIAKKLGLGRKRSASSSPEAVETAASTATPQPVAKPKRAAIKSKVETPAEPSAALDNAPKKAAGKSKRAVAKASPASKLAKPKAAKPKAEAKVESAPVPSAEV